MATIAQLDVVYTANTRALTRGLREAASKSKQASQQIGRHAKQMTAGFRRSINSVVNLRSAIGVLAGTSGIGLLVRSQMQAIDTTAKFARMIGESAREVSSLQHAAEITAGVTDKQFNMALQRMTRRIAEAANGTGEAKAAIADLGLEAAELARAGPAEAFRMISDAIQDVEDPTQRVRIAFKLFDSEGAKLVNTLNAGSSEIRRLQQEADDLGRSFSDIDAAQVEAANDALTRMSGALSGIGRILTIKLSGPIVAVSEQIREMSKDSADFGSAFVSAGGVALKIIGALADGVHALRIAWKGMQVIATGAIATMATSIESIIVFIARKLDQLTRKINYVIGEFNKFPGVDVPLIPKIETSGFVQDVKTAGNTAREVLSKTRSDLHDLMMESVPSEAIERFFREAQERMAELRASAGADGRSKGDGLSKIVVPSIERRPDQPSIGEGMAKVKEGADEHFAGIREGLSQSLIAGMKHGTSGAMDVLSRSLERWATTMLDSAFMGLLKKLPFGGGGGGGVASGIGKLFAGFFADGGRIPAGQFGIAGEAGPEVISGPATVTPMNQAGPVINIGDTIIQGNASAEQKLYFDARMAQLKADIFDQARRGRL